MSKYIIRTSDRKAFKGCRRRWGWSSHMGRNLAPRVTPKPLEFGTAWHEAMAVYYEPSTWKFLKDPNRSKFVQASARQMFLSVVNLQKQRYKKDKELFLELEQDFNERVELGLSMLDHYFMYAPKTDNFTPVRIEIEFEVPISDPRTGGQTDLVLPSPDGIAEWPVVYQGRLDGLVQDHGGWYWILEHKTAGQFGDVSHLDLDEQLTSYGWALQSQLGIPIKGAIYSEALKAAPKKPQRLQSPRGGRWLSVNKQQRTTYDLYMKAIKDNNEDPSNYHEFLTYLKSQGNPFFRRFQQHRTKEEYAEIGERIGWEAIDMCNPNLPLYPNPGRFNCSFCSFREPCLAINQGTDAEFMLRELFIDREEIQSELDYKANRLTYTQKEEE